MAADRCGEPPITVRVVGDGETLSFAADELEKYLGLVTGRRVLRENADACGQTDGLRIGLMSAFPEVRQPEVTDPRMDDAVAIHTRGDKGTVAGVNERSVLLAVYRYLTELGCRWVRPGGDGEFLPKLGALPPVDLEGTPSYRHRAVCIEGAVSYEHVLDMVDWLPKVGFNGYFIQFREAHAFFDRWYSNTGRPDGKVMALSREKAGEYTAGVEREIARRGLLYHKVGHGWTCEPFGISGLGWEHESGEPPPEAARYLAEVNGERAFWGGVALNTNLCYSNPEVRRIMNEAIASYAEEHPDIDLLHVWLADGSNNNCECDACREARPSDFYVMLLNELDELLTRKGLTARIVFLIYVDLLWPPAVQKLKNQSRFILMFAPIARTYSESFSVGGDLPAWWGQRRGPDFAELPPYERNRLEFPRGVAANAAFLRGWQKVFEGDSFDFDYHLMWDHVNDPGHMRISETIWRDMRGLRDIGLNGFVSCQVQRVFFPTGLAMAVMARTLWDSGLDFEDIARDYFASAFGGDGRACRRYLERLSRLFDPVFMRGEKEGAEPEAIEKLNAVPKVIEEFAPVIERNLAFGARAGRLPDRAEACRARSWFYLKHHAEICAGLAEALKAKASGATEEAASLWEGVRNLVWEKEPELHPVFDTWLFAGRMDGRFR